jgi:UDPglucose 6-dehydrogenase
VCVGDTRETASSFVCANLLEERANLHVYDPKVTREQMFIEFKVHIPSAAVHQSSP